MDRFRMQFRLPLKGGLQSRQITQMIDPLMLIQGLLVLVGVGWLLMYLTRKPKDKIDTINKKFS